jgi:hypothetical protein
MGINSNEVEHAIARLPEAFKTPEDMVVVGSKHTTAIKNNANASPEVLDAAAKWDAATKALDASNKGVDAAVLALQNARTTRAGSMRDCRARARGCLNAITVQAAGSEQVIKDLSMDVAERLESPLETVPQGLLGVRSATSAAAGWAWTTHNGNHGYMVQFATDVANPATYSAPVHCTKGQFHATAQTPGATLHARVAALDSRLPGGQTAFSTWIASVVSL